MGIEYEVKYAATAASFDLIRSFLQGDFRQLSMETTYYDTPDKALSRRSWTLRRRYENGLSVCTLKTPAGGFGRGEWDCEAKSIEEAIPVLCKLSHQEDLIPLTRDGVQPICGARFTRLAYDIASGTAQLEVALDRGVLIGGGREQPLLEVEVELKSGQPEDAVRYAKFLSRKFGLTAEPKSKFRRALELANGADG
jgi:inorganic triphosphatase YgiF